MSYAPLIPILLQLLLYIKIFNKLLYIYNKKVCDEISEIINLFNIFIYKNI